MPRVTTALRFPAADTTSGASPTQPIAARSCASHHPTVCRHSGAGDVSVRKVTFLLTNRCSLTCPHCFSLSGAASAAELSQDERAIIFDQLATLGTRTVVLSGGEPTLLGAELLEAMGAVTARGMRCGLLTNGLHLGLRRARALRSAGLSEVAVSLYTQDLTGLRDHGRYLARVGAAVDALAEAGAEVKVTIPVHAGNLGAVPDLYRTAVSLAGPVSRVRLYAITPAGRAEGLPVKLLPPPDWAALIKKVAEIRVATPDAPPTFYSPYGESPEGDVECPQSRGGVLDGPDAHISEKGELVLCGLLLRRTDHVVTVLPAASMQELKRALERYAARVRGHGCFVHPGLACCPLGYKARSIDAV
jgi:MoaA/NifB/PqqE/SkfB family radical SAM enzyme